jgi:hypothetical protein
MNINTNVGNASNWSDEHKWINYDEIDKNTIHSAITYKPKETTCKGICRRNKTQKGYLCDEVKNPSTFSTHRQKWCRINSVDVKNFEKYLGRPNNQMTIYGNYFWDNIVEENNPQSMCLLNNRINYNLNCSVEDTYKYYLTGLLIKCCAINIEEACIELYKKATVVATTTTAAMSAAALTVASDAAIHTDLSQKHLAQTKKLSTEDNRGILLFLLDELKNFIEKEQVDRGEISQDILNQNILSIENKIKEIDENDEAGYGKLVKELFKTCSQITKTNEQYNSSLGPTSLMDFFVDKIPDEYAMLVIRGANFMVQDDGALYQWAKSNIIGASGRFSTHKSIVDQYGYTYMYIDVYLHMVCGVVNINGKLYSWCQFEGAPMITGLSTAEVFLRMYHGFNLDKKALQEYVDHFADSLYYGYTALVARATGKKALNLAIGSSEHTDANPLMFTEKLDLGDFIPEKMEGKKTGSIKRFFETLINEFGYNFEIIKNSFTYELGIHNDLSARYNLSQNEQTITPYEREQQLINSPDGFNNGRGIRTIPSITTPIASSSYIQPSLAIGRGGKYKKKSKKVKRKGSRKASRKRKTMRHKK